MNNVQSKTREERNKRDSEQTVRTELCWSFMGTAQCTRQSGQDRQYFPPIVILSIYSHIHYDISLFECTHASQHTETSPVTIPRILVE